VHTPEKNPVYAYEFAHPRKKNPADAHNSNIITFHRPPV